MTEIEFDVQKALGTLDRCGRCGKYFVKSENNFVYFRREKMYVCDLCEIIISIKNQWMEAEKDYYYRKHCHYIAGV